MATLRRCSSIRCKGAGSRRECCVLAGGGGDVEAAALELGMVVGAAEVPPRASIPASY